MNPKLAISEGCHNRCSGWYRQDQKQWVEDSRHLVSPANTLKCHSAPELDAYDLLTPVPFETQSVSSVLASESP